MTNKMSEDKLFEQIKPSFEKCKREDMVEFISAMLAKLIINGVEYSCTFSPEYIEFGNENGDIKRIYANYEKSPIRDTLALDFSRHDAKVEDRLKREIAKKIPSPKGVLDHE